MVGRSISDTVAENHTILQSEAVYTKEISRFIETYNEDSEIIYRRYVMEDKYHTLEEVSETWRILLTARTILRRINELTEEEEGVPNINVSITHKLISRYRQLRRSLVWLQYDWDSQVTIGGHTHGF